MIGEGNWQQLFTEKPEAFARSEQRAYLASLSGVCLGSDAFFPFGDNIERAARSGVSYIAQPGGSIRDDVVMEACDKHNLVMAMTACACSITDTANKQTAGAQLLPVCAQDVHWGASIEERNFKQNKTKSA